tara:strand:- start:7031 stop:7651 length:621 start_codon:yes stop_codon:yes gene_type:complete
MSAPVVSSLGYYRSLDIGSLGFYIGNMPSGGGGGGGGGGGSNLNNIKIGVTPAAATLTDGTPTSMTVSGSGTQSDPFTAESFNQTHNSTGTIEFTVSGSGEVFWATSVSSEQNYDFARLFINGTQVSSISGNGSTDSGSSNLVNGDTVEFRYTKDHSVSQFSDKGYLTSLYIVSSGGSSSSVTPTAIYVGSVQVTEVYVGSTKVWG